MNGRFPVGSVAPVQTRPQQLHYPSKDRMVFLHWPDIRPSLGQPLRLFNFPISPRLHSDPPHHLGTGFQSMQVRQLKPFRQQTNCPFPIVVNSLTTINGKTLVILPRGFSTLKSDRSNNKSFHLYIAIVLRQHLSNHRHPQLRVVPQENKQQG